MIRHIALLIIVTVPLIAGYTTPATSVRWTMDSLVVHSGGAVTGAFPSYAVHDTVFIAAGDRLDVPKGATVRIGYRQGITVRGAFMAIGAPDSLITFTRLAGAADSVWQELRFEESATDTLCVLRHCIVEYGRTGLNFINASPTVEHSTIRNTGLTSGSLSSSGNYGIQCFGSNAVIRYDSIYNNAQYGININVDSSPLIEGCVIFDNNRQNTGFKNQISVGPQGVNSPVIRGNRILHTTPNPKTGAVSISAFFSQSGSFALIEGNHMHGNAYGVALLSQGASGVSAVIRNNRIIGNTYADPMAGGSGINCYALSPSYNTTVIAGNLLEGNSWGVTVQGIAAPNLGDLTNADTSDDGRNVFIGNRNRDTVFALYNNTAGALKAQNNYWGVSAPESVAAVIFDSSDIASLGAVRFTPFLTQSPVTGVRRPLPSVNAVRLHPNFPNPFNPATTIRFTLSAPASVRVTVYDLLGREVAVLAEGRMEGGDHAVRWNASERSSGVYLCRLEADAHRFTTKLLLQK